VGSQYHSSFVHRLSFAHPMSHLYAAYIHAMWVGYPSLHFVMPNNLGNQYHNKSAAGLPWTEADLSCNAAGG